MSFIVNSEYNFSFLKIKNKNFLPFCKLNALNKYIDLFLQISASRASTFRWLGMRWLTVCASFRRSWRRHRRSTWTLSIWLPRSITSGRSRATRKATWSTKLIHLRPFICIFTYNPYSSYDGYTEEVGMGGFKIERERKVLLQFIYPRDQLVTNSRSRNWEYAPT